MKRPGEGKNDKNKTRLETTGLDLMGEIGAKWCSGVPEDEEKSPGVAKSKGSSVPPKGLSCLPNQVINTVREGQIGLLINVSSGYMTSDIRLSDALHSGFEIE